MSVKLRAIPAGRHFWKDSHTEQVALKACDQNPDYYKREVPAHEVLVLALNESAAERRRGFFLYLPSRRTYDSKPSESRAPEQRRLPIPGAVYPNILCVDYAWDDADCAAFEKDSHRGRYLRCDAIVNTPPAGTPVYFFQYVGGPNEQLFETPFASLAIFATPASYFLLSNTTLTTHLDRSPTGKLSVPRCVWDPKQLDIGSESARAKKRRQHDIFQRSAAVGLAALYQQIADRCFGPQRTVQTSCTAQQIMQFLPRPAALLAASVGVPLGGGESADAPSRRGERRQTKRRKLARDDEGGGVTDE